MPALDHFDWTKMQGGYRVPYDPRPVLSRLEAVPTSEECWEELWEELHHQGDVGEASYVAVPLIARICCAMPAPEWNPYALVAIIELRRGLGSNPPLPERLQDGYFEALHAMAAHGAAQIARCSDPDTVRAILAILALDRGLRIHARFLIDFTDGELLQFDPESEG